MKLATKIAGLCLASMLMMGMALAGNASAAGPLWLLCLEGTNANNTKYEDSSCTKAKSTGAWESVSIGSKSDTVRVAVFTLRLRDKEAGTEVECSSNLEKDEGEGWVGSENKGQITKAKITTSEVTKRCTIIKSTLCKKIEEVHGVHLPWNTTIEEVGGALVTKISSSGAGEPGWTIKCSGAVDECTSINGEDEEVTLTNVVSGTVLLVKGVFKKTHNAECSLTPGKRSGQVEGLVAILLIKGNGLSINKL